MSLEIFGEMLSLEFFRRALLAGVLLSYLSSFYGTIVVQRGMSFLGEGLAHTAFGGVALGLLLGWQPLVVAVPFTILVSLGISWIKSQSELKADAAVGIFFALSAALGILFLSLKKDYAVDAFSYLFGSILGVSATDLWVIGALGVLHVLTLGYWKRWAYATFDRELALSDRQPVVREDYLFSVLIAVTVVVSVKIVGIILVSAFLVIPPSTARLWSKSFKSMTLLAALFSIVSALLGLVASYLLDVPSGAMIVLVQGFAFMVSFLLRKK